MMLFSPLPFPTDYYEVCMSEKLLDEMQSSNTSKDFFYDANNKHISFIFPFMPGHSVLSDIQAVLPLNEDTHSPWR